MATGLDGDAPTAGHDALNPTVDPEDPNFVPHKVGQHQAKGSGLRERCGGM